MPPKMNMTLVNGNGIYNNRPIISNRNVQLKPARKIGIDLNTTMIGRIQNAPAGCGGCGGRG